LLPEPAVSGHHSQTVLDYLAEGVEGGGILIGDRVQVVLYRSHVYARHEGHVGAIKEKEYISTETVQSEDCEYFLAHPKSYVGLSSKEVIGESLT
jgi:hypothetical protein